MFGKLSSPTDEANLPPFLQRLHAYLDLIAFKITGIHGPQWGRPTMTDIASIFGPPDKV